MTFDGDGGVSEGFGDDGNGGDFGEFVEGPRPRAAVPASEDLAFKASSTTAFFRPVFLAIAAAETPRRDSWW